MITSVTMSSTSYASGGGFLATAPSSAGVVPPPASLVQEGFDPNIGHDTDVRIGRTAAEEQIFESKTGLMHRSRPMDQADTAMAAMEKELGAIDRRISFTRPDIKSSDWDVTFNKDSGKLEVVGKFDKADKAWIEAQLNGDKTLTSAVAMFRKASVAYLETSADNPGYHGVNFYTGAPKSYNFSDVDKQMSGTVNFKEVIAAVKKMYAANASHGAITGYSAGYTALEIMASKLKSDPNT